MSELRSWCALPPEDRSSFTRAWLFLFVAYVGLRVLPLPKVEALLGRVSGGPRRKALPPARLGRLIDVAARHHLRPMTCLPRSLALRTLLHHQGTKADLRIGVHRAAGTLRAHAWVESSGRPVGEPAEVGRVFRSLEPARSAS